MSAAKRKSKKGKNKKTKLVSKSVNNMKDDDQKFPITKRLTSSPNTTANNNNTNNNNSNNNNNNNNNDNNNNNNNDNDQKQQYQPVTFSKNANVKERKYYITKETIKDLNNNSNLLEKLKKDFATIKATVLFQNNQIIIQQVATKLDNERILKMIQEVINLAFSEAEFNRLVEELASIEHPRNELLADPAGTFSNFITKTENGCEFVKHLQSGSPRKQWFSIKGDRIYWRDKKKGSNHLNRSMEMKSIVKIRPGKTTKIFKNKKRNKISEDRCFSIIGVRKTLNLECKNRLMRDEWFTYIEFLHRHYVRAKRDTVYLNDLDNPLDDDLDLID